MTLHIIVLTAFLAFALWAVLARTLIQSTIGLALASASVSIIMFQFDAPWAAVFELSVCTALISVVFVSTISLTNPPPKNEISMLYWDRFKRFAYLPIFLLLGGFLFLTNKIPIDFLAPHIEPEKDFRLVLWNLRHMDLFGQIILLFVGVFGVVVFFKERPKNE